MAGCIFCAIVAGEAPSERVYEDDLTVAFMDINPAANGHVLVVPRQHFADIWDIPEDTAAAVMVSTFRVATMIKEAIQPDGLNLFQSSRPAAWQTIFHLHVHLLPRWDSDPIELPWDPRHPPGDRSKVAEMAALIRQRRP
jgi:histidine triad (HIT) family protein